MLVLVLECTSVLLLYLAAGAAFISPPVPNYPLTIHDDDKVLVFGYIDRNHDGFLTEYDLDEMFNIHPEAVPDKEKLLSLVKTVDGRGTHVNVQGFGAFMNEKTVIYAVFECSFVKSKSLRKQCYEDQIITYVHLVLPTNIIETFFDLFGAPEGIKMDNVREFFTEGNTVQQEENAHKFLWELGRENEIITEFEFGQYVKQEDLHDDFRACYMYDSKDGDSTAGSTDYNYGVPGTEDEEYYGASSADDYDRATAQYGPYEDQYEDEHLGIEDTHEYHRAEITEVQGEKQYNYKCLLNQLLRYTTASLTEMDIALIFSQLDTSGDEVLLPGDLIQWCTGRCDPATFLSMMNMEDDKDSSVEFGDAQSRKIFAHTEEVKEKCMSGFDVNQICCHRNQKASTKVGEVYENCDGIMSKKFRTFIKRDSVKIRIERNCKKAFASQAERLNCYNTQLFEVVADHHKPIWLTLPASDMVFLFEGLDVDNNGQIQIVTDLQRQGYSREIAQKFLTEMNGEDEDKKINLKEFNEYVGDPSVVYALSDCKKKTRGPDRTACYKEELENYITNILEKQAVESFFQSFDVNNEGVITKLDVKAIMKQDGKVEIFFKELGMGDYTVNRAEFKWFVRQQELSDMFTAASCIDNVCLTSVLELYVLNKLTEIDIQELFNELDINKSWEIEVEDLQSTASEEDDSEDLDKWWLQLHPRTNDQDQGEDDELTFDKTDEENKGLVPALSLRKERTDDEIEALILQMDTDNDNVINFEEFRIFIAAVGRKKYVEEKCTAPKKIHGSEMRCYKEEIWNLQNLPSAYF